MVYKTKRLGIQKGEMMKIYIGYEEGKQDAPIGILLAESEDRAWLAFTAMKETVSHVEELDINNLKRDCDFGVVFLLTSAKRKVHKIGGETHMFRKWKRGL